MKLLILLAVCTIIILIFAFSMLDKLTKKIECQSKERKEVMKLLQEIACDYKVRIIKSGRGSVDTSFLLSSYEYGCYDFGIDNKSNYKFDFIENGDYYLINFRVFGRCYMAYALTEFRAWSIVVNKAREESRTLFGRSGSLDRYKI